ncbi:hypothetical protein LTR66_001397 [Elasticomyces elasticus]|nr:hypothetical protein LTR66_001397 [Elasticomyces elasticus]
MTRGTSNVPSKRLILSYIFDWIIIIGIAAVGAGFGVATPYRRHFSLLDLTISYPLRKDTVSVTALAMVSLVAPGIIIFLVVLIFIPGPTAARRTPAGLFWRRKLWELNTGWMGLGLSLATAFLLTNGLKNINGKPRPNLLARCEPDLANIAAHVVGGYGQPINERWTLVSASICRNPNMSILNDGFRSFPSGHSSFSWAGLMYLTLFLCAKFAIAIPFLPAQSPSRSRAQPFYEQDINLLPLHRRHGNASLDSHKSNVPLGGNREPEQALSRNETAHMPIRNQAAAPPNWVLVLALIPIGVALYISSTRFTDFMHFGFDIISGALIGIATSWFAFRWYHLPIRQGAGWSWGARSRDRAFGIGVGVDSYVGPEGWSSKKSDGVADVESGATNHANLTGPGLPDATNGTNGGIEVGGSGRRL